MKFRYIIHIFVACIIFCYGLTGCSDSKPLVLDKDDIHFAGFYCDYLLFSGVAPAAGSSELVALNSADINELLVRHALTRESMKRKIEIYKRNSERWRSVLELARINIRKKTGAQ